MDPFAVALPLFVVATFLVSVGVVRLSAAPGERWGDRLRAGFVAGVPWGTLVVTGFVLAMYLFVQGGLSNFSRPVVLPFRSWSYLYPLGLVTAPFAHASESHLVGNLVGTVVVAPIAEYAWGHYPQERGSESFSSRSTNPWVRAVVVFPLVAIAIGLVTSLFSMGPVIGFSGVVYAFVGFAIVRFPVTTLVAYLGATSVVYTTYQALRWPIVTASAQPSGPSLPGWAQIAVQGHALGLFAGLILAAVLFRRRGYRPDPVRFWTAILFYSFASQLWAIYWFLDGSTVVLFRGVGVVVVATLAIVVTLSVVASERPLVPAALRRRLERFPGVTPEADGDPPGRRILELALPDRTATDRVAGRICEIASGARSRGEPPEDATTRRGAAVVAVVLVSGLVAGMGVPSNLFTVDDRPAAGDDSVAVGDYTVSYAEGVEDPRFTVVDAFGLGDAVGVETSGVIVSSPRRNIWIDAVSTGQLAYQGRATVTVGGVGWQESVTAIRRGWNPVGNDTVYVISLQPEGEAKRRVFAAEPKRADVRVEGNNFSVVPTEESFALAVSDGENASVVAIPDAGNESVAVNGISFVREERTVFATTNETRVAVATREEYQ